MIIKENQIWKFTSHFNNKNFITIQISDISDTNIFLSKIIDIVSDTYDYTIGDQFKTLKSDLDRQQWQLQGRTCVNCDTYFGYLEKSINNDFICYKCGLFTIGFWYKNDRKTFKAIYDVDK